MIKTKQSSTSNLYTHLATHHINEYTTVAPKGGTGIVKHRPCHNSSQRLITSMVPYKRDSQKTTEITKAVTAFITSGTVPIYTVDKPSFRQLVSTLDPRYSMPSRNYFSRTAIPELYTKVKDEIKRELDNISHMSCTMDGWSSACREPYVSITAHYIDSDWILNCKCLHTMYTPETHTAENLATFVREGLKEYGTDMGKVSSFTTDNARNMISACQKLSVLRIGCFGHVLHNAINNALTADDSIKRVLQLGRKIVSTFSYSFQFREKLYKCQKENDIQQRMLVQDVATRWNSKYTMMERIVDNIPVISHLFSDSKFTLYLVKLRMPRFIKYQPI